MNRELRCPAGPRRQFAQLDQTEALLQISCPDCRKHARRLHPDLAHVLHGYSVLTGVLETTVWQWPSGAFTPVGHAPIRVIRGGEL